MSQIAEGRRAPTSRLAGAPRGRRISLRDFKGKDVILYFYPKDDTPGCTEEACGFRDHWKDSPEGGASSCSASPPTTRRRTRSSRDKYKLPFTLLSDPDRKVMTA